MPTYKVEVNGENFLLDRGFGPARLGFFTARIVIAETPEEAERDAIEAIRKDPEVGGGVLNDPENPPLLHTESVSEISAETAQDAIPGYAFYAEEDA